MATCFVIQPFDKGPFDKRYEDVFAPAIRAADLEPYRGEGVKEGVKSFVDSPASSHGRESGKLYFIGGKTCEGRVLTKTINSQQKI